MGNINTNEFIAFTRTLEGQELSTRSRRRKFTVRSVGGGLEFTPLATDKPRFHNDHYIERVLDEFHRTGSWKTADYLFTINASYQLAIIDLYLAARRSN